MILHISNAFLGTKVHRNLSIALDKAGVGQYIFTVLRSYKKPKVENLIQFTQSNSAIYFSRTLQFYHRILFRLKISQIKRDLESQIDLSTVKIIHAATLLTDGFLAYKIYKEFKIPYIVSIRSTDVDYFFKFRPDLVYLAYKVLDNAEKVIFVSPALKKRFSNNFYIKSKINRWQFKFEEFNNGIEQHWIDHISPFKMEYKVPRLLFVGRTVKRKNLPRLIRIIYQLKEEFPGIKLTIIGPKGNDFTKLNTMSKGKYKDVVQLLGSINESGLLREAYKQHDLFVMPSYNETFGLVYIEALSQGVPIIYTKDDGIDGIFQNDKIGIAVNPFNDEEILQAIRNILINYNTYTNQTIVFNEFNWDVIAKKYVELYHRVLK